MALQTCNDCNREVSSSATQCPHCGAPIKKKMGCLKIIGALFLFFVILAAIGGGGGKSSNDKNLPKFAVGAPVVLKDVEVTVTKVEYVNSIKELNQFATEAGSGIYLILYVSVKNNSDQAMTFTSNNFKILRGNSTYDPDLTATMYAAMTYKCQQLTKINPGITAEGIVAFNLPDIKVPSNLKVSYSVWGPAALVPVL